MFVQRSLLPPQFIRTCLYRSRNQAPSLGTVERQSARLAANASKAGRLPVSEVPACTCGTVYIGKSGYRAAAAPYRHAKTNSRGIAESSFSRGPPTVPSACAARYRQVRCVKRKLGRRAVSKTVSLRVIGVARQRRGDCTSRRCRGPPRRPPFDLDLTSEAPGSRIAGSIMSSRFGRTDHDDFSCPSTPSISLKQLRTMCSRRRRRRRIRGCGRSNPSVEEHDHRRALAGFSRARWNTSSECRSVSPTYLLSSSGPLMFRKNDLAEPTPRTFSTCLASELATALAMSVLPQPGGR